MSRGKVTPQMGSQKFKALLSGGQSDPTISGDSSETTIKKEVVKNTAPSPAAFNHCANSPPVIDLSSETPNSLCGRVQSAMDAGRAATVPPVPASLVRNLTMAANVGQQSESNSVQPAASELDTIAVSTGRLGERIADSLGAVVGGEASHADVGASEEQCNEPRPTDPERCIPRRTVGTTSDDDEEDFNSSSDDDEEDLYSSTPHPPTMHRRDTAEPTAIAGMLQPEPLGDRERPREHDDSREQVGHQADETRLRGAGGQLASPVSMGAESGQRVASQVADESRDTDDVSDTDRMEREYEASKERNRQMRQRLREEERECRAQEDAASRRLAEMEREFQELQRQSQNVTKRTKVMRRIAQPSTSD
ncbi:hypothetical protein KC318_g10495 [Hortaea werneckii]|nr:hypothetical protein KC334_g17922 [Hortaea werneckii]KAI6988311.1 hypothetical protein KC355_g10489 [Hortaea werneckii]KAI7659770.1 hypothetical protein KC318_g10495 [Hortaea werneckii]